MCARRRLRSACICVSDQYLHWVVVGYTKIASLIIHAESRDTESTDWIAQIGVGRGGWPESWPGAYDFVQCRFCCAQAHIPSSLAYINSVKLSFMPFRQLWIFYTLEVGRFCFAPWSFFFFFFMKWAASWQNQQSECMPSKDSDQPGLKWKNTVKSLKNSDAWKNYLSLTFKRCGLTRCRWNGK